MSNFKSIKEYFSDQRTFVVPYYQRGYKWSLQTNEKRGDKLHLSILLDDLTSEFKKAIVNDKLSPYFEYYLQGITVKEKDNEIELVDGQQRTTSLFILLSSLQQKGVTNDSIRLESKLLYKVRKAANETLQGFIKGDCDGDDSIQDIAALKKAWQLCNDFVDELDQYKRSLFGEFLLENIKVIYINLDEHQKETEVFSMMNKAKADMNQTDLVKSNLLREASRQLFGALNGITENDGMEWQINQLRGKLASEWDNWRKWWENKQHIDFVKMTGLNFPSKESDEPDMAAILKFNAHLKDNDILDKNLFEYYKNQTVKHNVSQFNAIEIFDELRLIQSILEEWHADFEIFNYLGMLFKGCGLKEKEKMLKKLFEYYISSKDKIISKIKEEYKTEILGGSQVNQFITRLISDDNAYFSQYTEVARQLLRMNVLMTNKQGQRFDFSLYEEHNFKNEEEIKEAQKRSLEHIKPQTYKNDKVSKEEWERLEKLTNTVGNLVLVPRGLNSKLSNKNPEEKKHILFEEMLKPDGKNFGLWLHTLSVFGSHSEWLSKEINKNGKAFEDNLITFFN
jgi:uncharacterized protein (UPF0297 family)